MTGCNLVIFVAACTGFAAIKTFSRGPRAPAVALVGPDSPITEAALLSGTKEFYRGLIKNDMTLNEVAATASRETEPIRLEPEPFALLAFESMAESLIISMRHDELSQRMERVRQYMREVGLAEAKKESLRSIMITQLQRRWDELFLIDVCPANAARFGVNMSAIVDMILSCQNVPAHP